MDWVPLLACPEVLKHGWTSRPCHPSILDWQSTNRWSVMVDRPTFHENMLQAGMASQAVDRLKDLSGRLERHAGFAEVLASLQAGHAATLNGVWG